MAGIIAFIIGIASASIFCDAASLVIIAVSFLVCFFMNRNKIAIKNIIIYLVLFSAGFGYYALTDSYLYKKYGTVYEEITATIKVVSEPEYEDDKIVFIGKIKEFNNKKATVSLCSDEKISFYDTVIIKGEISSIKESGGRYLFNNKSYYYSKNIYFNFRANEKTKSVVEGKGLLKDIYRLRNKISHIINMNFTYDSGAFIKGILLGEKERTDELDDALKRTGLSHIVVVSGMHFSIINMFLMLLLRRLGINRKKSSLISIPVSFFFALFAGFSASVIRAFIILTVLNVADLISKERSTDIYLVSVTAFLMLIFNPHIIYDIGFILSFMSISGILLLNGKILNKIKIPGVYVKESISVSLSANIFTIPFVVYYFNGLSLTFIVSNIAVGFLVPLVMLYGIIAIALSFINMRLGWITAYPLDLMVGVMVKFIISLSAVPSGYINTLAVERYLISLYFLGLYLLIILKVKWLKLIITFVIFGYYILSLFYPVETYLLNRPDLYVFCGKDGGKAFISCKNTDIFVDLSVSNSIDYGSFISSKTKDKLDLCIFGNAYNIKNAKVEALSGEKVCIPADVSERDPLKEYINSFEEVLTVKDKIELKYDDIYLTLKVGKSYNINEVKISYKGREIIITNNPEVQINHNYEYILTDKIYDIFKNYDVLNCRKKEIERIWL